MQFSPLIARGRVIAAARMLAGLDQHQLAEAAGLSPSTISRIELGRRNVRQDTLRAVSTALERLGIDLTQNNRTGHHAVGTSYA
ncbi:helix-turn-helix domain-containing protein [Roseomonas sp. BN140053]|uniref:helix-turn-helix domain-containing protein n=1 Tax=Roseomonas sp. BN140053 TaxID=3391898 RepID=UPI0039E986FB